MATNSDLKMQDVNANRKKFIKDWAETLLTVTGAKKDAITVSYTELAISQVMDSALKHKEKLDIQYDDGYVL